MIHRAAVRGLSRISGTCHRLPPAHLRGGRGASRALDVRRTITQSNAQCCTHLTVPSAARRRRAASAPQIEDAEDRGRGTLNTIEGRRQRIAIATIQVQVVAGWLTSVEANGFGNHEGDSLGFKFARVA